MLAQLAALRVLRKPLLEPRPLAEERLVRDLDRSLVRGQRADRVGQALNDRSEHGVLREIELGARERDASWPALRLRP